MVAIKILKRFYQDSLKLMRVSAEIKNSDGVVQAFAFMATETNKKSRIKDEFMDDGVRAAGADDLVLMVECENETVGKNAIDEFEKRISSSAAAKDDETENLPATFEQGKILSDANLAVISVPGIYAAVQTLNALNNGMNVMLFSDNVSVEDEIMLKDYAASKNLLVMGPDCGTAIIGVVPLCFANAVKSGKVGIIGASGTGTQELTVLLDSAGCGITHAIGTGGRDLSAEVAGRTAFAALELLAKDAPTEFIAIISKPPSKEVADRITEAVKKTGKPCVLAFLGASAAKISDRIFIAGTIEEAAAKIGALCKGNNPDSFNIIYDRKPFGYHGLDKFKPSQKAVRGLYTGGTLASEAQTVLAGAQAQVIDLGDDEYTKGALHPMIDPANRSSHIHEAYADDKVAVILCDVVLGYGSHNDPAGVLAKDVKSAKEKTNAHKIVIACVVGSDADPQGKAAQIKALEEAGIFVFPSNQYAAEIAAKLAKKLQGVE